MFTPYITSHERGVYLTYRWTDNPKTRCPLPTAGTVGGGMKFSSTNSFTYSITIGYLLIAQLDNNAEIT